MYADYSPTRLEQRGERPGGERPDADGSPLVEGLEGEAIRCARCGAEITTASLRAEVMGAHEHVRMNPAGFVFTIRCFSDAAGARAVGEPSSEFAWFPHYDWQVAVCRACGAHLGWWFSSVGDRFVGLIREAISS